MSVPGCDLRRPVFYTLGAYIAGLVGSHITGLTPFAAYLFLVFMFALYLPAVLTAAWRRFRDPALIAFYVAVCALNCAVRCQPAPPLPAELRQAEEVLVFAQVMGEYRESYGRMRLTVLADSFHLGSSCYKSRQRMLVTAPRVGPGTAIGDSWSFVGAIAEPRSLRNPGGFDWRAYYERVGVRYRLDCVREGRRETIQRMRPNLLLSRLVSKVRGRIRDLLDRHIQGEEAALLNALLLGERSGVDRSTLDVFTEAGVMHILAVSGLHVGIMWLALVVLLRILRVPRKYLLLVSIAVLGGYCLLVGHRPPVIRATIVLGAFSLTSLLERELDSVNALCVAAFVILLLNPLHLFDAGFQLSFMCTVSIIKLFEMSSPVLSGVLLKGRTRVFRWLLGSLLVSISAQMGSAPLVMFHFNRVAVAPVAANLIVVPLTSIDLCLGMLVTILDLARVPVAGVAGAANWLSLRLTLLSAKLFSAIPFSSFRVTKPQVVWICAWYVFLLLLPDLRNSRRARFLSLVLFLGVLNLWVWDSALATGRARLSVAFLDVGQGDCAVLETKSGRTLVIDAGPAFGPTNSGENVLAPFLWSRGVREIDILVLTHPHNDHIGGMEFILENFSVDLVLDAGIPVSSRSYLDFLKDMREKRIEYRVLRKGMGFLFEGSRFDVLHPDGRTAALATVLPGFDSNDASVVLKVACGGVDLLLTGDINERAETAIRSIEELTVLKAPHHGSEHPNKVLLEKGLVPSMVVFSVGLGNRFGFPSERVVAEYRAGGAQIYRTDRDGCSLFTTDGKEWEVVSMARLRRMRPIERFLMRYGLGRKLENPIPSAQLLRE